VPERADHFFFKCKFIEGFWYKIFNWWEAEWETKDDDHGKFDFSIKDEGIVVDKDSAGCGGILRDTEGVARALFSSPIAANDVHSADVVGAVLLALEVFISLEWKINDSLFVEIGSKVVFNWCVNKSMGPWLLQSTFVDIERKIEKVGSVVFSMAKKKENEMASTLAIVGINRENMFKA
ncbi:hypothetical protein Gohar_003437, partial [Gossypium harknessii]|nr:hypothetical protein [Gossypium harknessii]